MQQSVISEKENRETEINVGDPHRNRILGLTQHHEGRVLGIGWCRVIAGSPLGRFLPSPSSPSSSQHIKRNYRKSIEKRRRPATAELCGGVERLWKT